MKHRSWNERSFTLAVFFEKDPEGFSICKPQNKQKKKLAGTMSANKMEKLDFLYGEKAT